MSDYQLLDAGGGRKLERFGPYVLDRPSPPAEEFAPAAPQLWSEADARYERTSGETGQWTLRGNLPETWTVAFGPIVMEVRLTPFGHVGLFPEQAANWEWLAEHLTASEGPRRKVLNLFAYTGGSTLAAAAAGAEVTHIDAAKNVVAWARRNAELSGLQATPIRWIAEDARKFVARELRRGNRYDAIILDPPSYGHGPQGEAWRIDEHLPPLLADCARLTQGQRALALLTCHTPGYDPAALSALLAQAGLVASTRQIDAAPLQLATPDGRALSSGAAVRMYGGGRL